MNETGPQRLFEAFKRRRVFRVATIYVIAFWPIIQLVDILSPALEIPDYFMKYLVFGFFGCLPFVLMFVWLYDLRQQDIEVKEGEPQLAMLGSKAEFSIIAALVILVSGLFIVQFNIDEKTEIANIEPTVPEKITPEKITYDSIAVLPFVTFSAEPRDQFFADGLTEELLNVLSRITDLRVAARTSSFAYKGVNKNVQLIGNELNVATILEGSVRKNDVNDTIRITAQLIDVADGAHLWSKTFDREFTDVFKIQDEISAAVAEQLKVTLSGNIKIQPRSLSANPEALIANSMGQAELSKRTEAGFNNAARFFQKAIDEDPKYALAYSGLADANTLLVSYGFLEEEEGLSKATQAVETALSIDSGLGIAWASKGLILSQNKETETEAKEALSKAMELNPSYAMASMWYASMLHDDSDKLKFFEKAYKLDPKSAVAGYNVANTLVGQGRDMEAVEVFSQIVEADPYYAKAYHLIGRINDRSGQISEAIRQYERSYALKNDISLAVQISSLYSDVGNFSNADTWLALADADIPEIYRSRLVWLKLRRHAAEGDEEKIEFYLNEILEQPLREQSDYYLKTLASYYLNDLAGAIGYFQKSIDAPIADESMNDFVHETRLDAQIAVAFAYQTSGQKDSAQNLISDLEKSLDKRSKFARRLDSDDMYRRAQIAALRDDSGAVLGSIQTAIDSGWREHWRPAFDPVMRKVIKESSFQNLLVGLETRIEIIREQFEMEAQFASAWGE